jgi:hypothetical protein
MLKLCSCSDREAEDEVELREGERVPGGVFGSGIEGIHLSAVKCAN